jgi:hypothetical protein
LLVEKRRKQFEAGEEWALLDAVDFCARAGMTMPLWLANAFCERYLDWFLFQVKTLDEAFKVEGDRKGKHIERRARREWLKPRVVLEVLRLHDPEGENMPLDDVLFERVGETLGCGKTLAKDLYYDVEGDNPWAALLPRIL